jgi:hypothetical protein
LRVTASNISALDAINAAPRAASVGSVAARPRDPNACRIVTLTGWMSLRGVPDGLFNTKAHL